MITALIAGLINAYTIIIFIYVIMSWIPHMTGVVGDVYGILGRLCDPYLDLFRRLIPPIGGMVDITPIIALLVLQLIERIVFVIL